MEANGRGDGRDRRLRLDSGFVAPAEVQSEPGSRTDVVFDFSGLDPARLSDMGLILTARLRAAPGERVWARALPLRMWHLLRGLGLDHLFRVYPGPTQEMN